MESLTVLIIFIVAIIFVIIIKKLKNSNSMHIATFKTTNPHITSKEELIKAMKENNMPQELIDNLTNNMENSIGTYTSTSTSHKVTYVNGQKASEEKNTTHNTLTPLTNCPNCGAKIKDKTKENCEYCHTIFTKIK